ncbi:phosphocholine-specific phospholipase C [Cyclobacterium marinum]|uniref:phosphocholine-specific phospholipase C n=1 Tax=Cyclobacterium marinum TaxID=104 RepID=UPI0030DB0894|tara:strand:- start:104198 stop:106756 length:2559 start_codon:yes stop_codon:yes gene_type:complete
MNENRRDFLKKAALFSGGMGLWGVLPASIEKAMAINPEPGTTFLDAEHVVLLMQENRSFDHCFGKLKGVRGYNDPRTISLPNKDKVWIQRDKNGNAFTPFRFNINETKATWMSDIPHSWENQVDARNNGKYDGWIEAKRPGRKEYKHVPMTMGYYERQDIPFYYAFADAFTVCDQHFCGALTGTTTNRNYHWAGKTVGNVGEKPLVRNGEHTYGKEVDWKTFPDRLQDNGISWKVYQNEVSLPTMLKGDDSSWLANFTDNNLEWFKQFEVRYTPGHYEFLKHKQKNLPIEIAKLEASLQDAVETDKEDIKKEIASKKEALIFVNESIEKFGPEAFEKLSPKEKEMHQRAFTTNIADPDYHKTEILEYEEDGEKRATKIPKGDIFHEFRKDVNSGNLPTVSYLVAPKNFSDHPSAPWYGAWYVSEALEILTKNPEVWKKTIFILNYDENDGYFDHVPPFVPPKPNDPNAGKVSKGVDARTEFVFKEQEENYPGMDPEDVRESPVGLGYRVPLIVASPWSRGGWVNSEVCDISSTIMFMEKFLSHKTGKKIREENISSWRRTISGDLTSVFRPFNGEKIELPNFLTMESHVKKILNASYKDIPDNFKILTESEVSQVNNSHLQSPILPKQEPGTKPSNALAYELYVDGEINPSRKAIVLNLEASNKKFGDKALGAPFLIYAPGAFKNPTTNAFETASNWSFAVKPGDKLDYEWPLDAFEGGLYHLQVYGPNGYYREFKGNKNDPQLSLVSSYTADGGDNKTGIYKLDIENLSNTMLSIKVTDNAYQHGKKTIDLKPGEKKPVRVPTVKSQGWYDFTLIADGNDAFSRRYCGRLELGKDSISDPLMGGEMSINLS